MPTERPRAVAEPQYGPSDKVIVYKTVPIILSTKDTGSLQIVLLLAKQLYNSFFPSVRMVLFPNHFFLKR